MIKPVVRRAFALSSVLFWFYPNGVSAHNFGSGKGAYENFLSGNQAVLADVPILLGLIATGIVVSNWKPDGLPKVWLFFIIGVLAGMALGLSGLLPAIMPTYVTVCLIGLLGAAAPRLPVAGMRLLVGISGVILANAVLSGHTLGEIQPFAYAGILFAINLGLAISAGIVSLSLEKLPYGWVNITWRALLSWIVAISIMAMVLMLKVSGFNG